MIGAVHHRAARNAGATVIGVLVSSSAKSATVAEEWQVPPGYTDLAELLSDHPDVVHVCTPNRSHYELAQFAASFGAPHGR